MFRASLPFQPDSPRQRPHILHETYQLPRVRLITPDDGHRRCPKRVEFRDKIKHFGYLMHLVDYLYEDIHDARSLGHKVSEYLPFLRTVHYGHCCHQTLDELTRTEFALCCGQLLKIVLAGAECLHFYGVVRKIQLLKPLKQQLCFSFRHF